MAENDVGKRLRQLSKAKRKKERFLVSRMWFSTLMSYIFPDMSHIPDNIGNNIFIGNNRYITKNSISSIIFIKEFSLETPIGLISDHISEVKSKVKGVTINHTIKSTRHRVDKRDKGLENRVKQWMFTMNNPNASDRTQKRAARLLHTYDEIQDNTKLYKSHVYITVRAKDGNSHRMALKAVREYLDSIQAEYKVVRANIKRHLEHIALMSNDTAGKSKEVPYTLQSAVTLSEMLPISQGLNEAKGSFMGIERRTKSPYYINYRNSSAGKNVYVVGVTGFGKTFLVANWLLDGRAIDYSLSLMDLKGNDYDAICASMGGVTVSMRADSTEFINTFVLDKEGANGEYEMYFKERLRLSLKSWMIMARLSPEKQSRGNSLLNYFFKSFFADKGVLASNPNTWERTKLLHPFDVFKDFDRFLSPSIRESYGDVAEEMFTNLSEYLTKEGPESHMFTREYKLEDIINSRVVRYDFGMLESGRAKSEATFKLRVEYMRLINDEHSRMQKALGRWVIKVLEESQIAEEYLLEIYVEEMTLRRAQNQITILLGNSTAALEQNPIAQPLLANINILVVGSVNTQSRNFLIKEYSLEKEEENLKNINSNPKYENTFLLVNRMKRDSTTALLKAYVPPHVASGKIFRNVDTTEELL